MEYKGVKMKLVWIGLTYVEKISFDFGGEIFKEYHVHDIYIVQHLYNNSISKGFLSPRLFSLSLSLQQFSTQLSFFVDIERF